jgi:hypothetical protein
MSFYTPVDGEPAVAEHVAQVTETLSGLRSIPVDLLSPLTVASKAVGLSATAGNTLAWNADGFYSNAVDQTAADLRYLQLTGGVLSGALTAPAVTIAAKPVNVSPDSGNALVWRSNGFYTSGSGGNVTVVNREEFFPTTTSTTVTLAQAPDEVLSVSRNGVEQSATAGDYSIAGAVLTFSSAFAAGERVAVLSEVGTSVPVDAYDTTTADARFVNVTGDNLTGPLTFGGDATLSRTGPGALRADSHLGVGVNPAAWWSGLSALQLGQGAALRAHTGSANTSLVNNSVIDPAIIARAVVAGAGSQVNLNADGSVNVATAPSVAAGAAQTFTTRLAVAPTGTLTLTPDAGSAALVVGGSGQINSTSNLFLHAPSQYVAPSGDNTIYLGGAGSRWITVYAVAGAINTSSREYKEGITPLDPVACYQAAKDVRWYDFAYLPPAYQEPEPVEGEEAETREARLDESKAAYLKTVQETAPARHQRGFVFPTGDAKDEAGGTLPPVPDLFGLSDRRSTTPQADLATLGCALQHLINEFEAFKAQVGGAASV